MKLVSVHKVVGGEQQHVSTQSSGKDGQSDPDLQRAKDLIALHYDVKVKHQQSGLDDDLLQARRDVYNVLSQLAQNRS